MNRYNIGDITSLNLSDKKYFYEIIDIIDDEYIYMFLTDPDPVASLDTNSFELFEKYTRKVSKLEKALL